MELFDKRSFRRAEVTFRCLPLNSHFYYEAKSLGLKAEYVYHNRQKFCVKGCNWFRDIYSVELSFRWMIAVGILRREVDGQGLTASIRLTPFGRQIYEQTSPCKFGSAGLLEYTLYSFCRKLKVQ